MRFSNRKFWFKKDDWFAFTVLSFAVIYSFCLVSPALSGSELFGNDNSYHFALTHYIAKGISLGSNILDVWVPYGSCGHPFEHYYQHFPHVFTALLYFVFLEKLPLLLVYKGVIVALLTFLPLSFYYGTRTIGFNKETASLAGLMSMLISSNCSYGIEYCSYFGWGLFTQLFAVFLLPLCISSVYVTVKSGRHISLSVLLLCLVSLSHIIFGYIAVVTCFLFLFSLRNISWFVVLKRIIAVLLFTALILSYWVVPMYMDRDYYRIADSPKHQVDSYGAHYVISGFLCGDLLDTGRLPVFTIFVLIGLASCAFNRNHERNRFLLLGFFVWLVMYIGKGDIWVLNFIPLSKYLYFFRFVNGLHFFAIMLASLGLFQVVRIGRKRGFEILSIALLFALVYPMLAERADLSHEYIRTFDDIYLGDNRTHFDAVNLFLKNSDDGRVFVGTKTGLATHFLIGLTPVYSGKDALAAYTRPYTSLCFPYAHAFNGSFYGPYDKFNVRYILSGRNFSAPEFSQLVFDSGPYEIYSVNTSGYFGFVDSHTGKTHVYGSRDFSNCGGIVSEDVGYNYYSATVDVQHDCDVVLKVTYHPGWVVHIDGVEKEMFNVSPCFMGVDVGEGLHKVEFFYKVSFLKSALFIFGLVILMLLILFDLRMNRQNKP